MGGFDVFDQLKTTRTVVDLTWWGMTAIILITIALAYYKRQKDENYKRIVIVGIGITIGYLIVMSYVAMSLVEPIYHLTD
jgi:hypothetical protein